MIIKIPVRTLAETLDADPIWLGSVLGRVMEITNKAEIDPAEVCAFLDKATRAASAPSDLSSLPPGVVETLTTISEMGPDENSCREWLVRQFKKHGLEVIGRGGGASAPRFTLRRSDGKEMWVVTHVALRPKEKTNQVGFTVSGLDLPELSWFVFISRPWGRAYLRLKKEILGVQRTTKKDLKTAFLTFSPGTEDHLLERRIEELITRDEFWNLHRKGTKAKSK